MKKLFLALALFILPIMSATAVELRDGKLVPTYPQELSILEQCKQPNTCAIVTREMVIAFAQAYADAKLAEFEAEVRAQFQAAVEARAREIVKQLQRNSL